MEIKFCENNYTHGIEDVVNKIKEQLENVTVEVESCLGYCGDCAVGPFALVDDELVQADTPEELLEEIKGYL
ncbi:DUF1450 domain-containing protein [Anaeromicrobium sediminis]|uniref:DUF1450 domain-containing protein n=1 Tax=Anaeromicrobium sediminis TaxID=1478221 RepID=UPI001FA8FD66|nr:DUF1450 domain-containing protein [Anaeromicrobium sediminis]